MDELRSRRSHPVDTTTETIAYSSNMQVVCRYPDPPRSGRISSSTAHNYSSSRSFNNDPEVKRRKRVAVYKAYAVEGKMKATLRSGFRWVKNKYSELVHGY